MKIKFKFTTQKIFKLIFATLFIANLVALFFATSFIGSQVFDTMFMNREDLLNQSSLTVEDIDIERFNKVVEKIDNKKNMEDVTSLNNIFD
jgi:hypothetical protein